jgi:Zn-dependent protease
VNSALIISFVLMLPVLLFSLAVHEMAHAWTADRMGDRTARAAGRLTINPLRHLDLFGTVMLVASFAISQGGFFFGWAKPVPIDPSRLDRHRWGQALVSLAGPASNLVLAVVSGALTWAAAAFSDTVAQAISIAFYLNMTLAILNILPIPPLDGWRFVTGLLPVRWRVHLSVIGPYEQYVFLVFLMIIIVRPEIFSAIFAPPIDAAANVLLPPVAR